MADRRSDRPRRRGAARRPARIQPQALRHVRGDPADRRRRRLLRPQAAVRQDDHHLPGPVRRAAGGDRGQPAQAARRDPRQRLRRQGGAVHQPLQRLRDPARLPDGRARVHGRDQGRGGGDHPPRGEDALRHRQRDRAEDHGRAAQGLRRRLLRDVRPRLRARPDRRLAVGRDQRDGRRGRGRDHLPQAGRRRPRTRRPSARS